MQLAGLHASAGKSTAVHQVEVCLCPVVVLACILSVERLLFMPAWFVSCSCHLQSYRVTDTGRSHQELPAASCLTPPCLTACQVLPQLSSRDRLSYQNLPAAARPVQLVKGHSLDVDQGGGSDSKVVSCSESLFIN